MSSLLLSARPSPLTRPSLVGLLVFAVFSAGSATAQTNHNVEVLPNNTFFPANLTIKAGDSVTWENKGGNHNVEGTSFRCANGCDDDGGDGSPSTAAWKVTRTFTTPGLIEYVCIVHESLGMVGTITVEASDGGSGAGTLGIVDTTVAAVESSGTATVQVARTGGSAGSVSVDFATSDGSAVASDDYLAAAGQLAWGDGDVVTKAIVVTLVDDSAIESDETINLMLSSPTGGATLGDSAATITITDDDDSSAETPGVVDFSLSTVTVLESVGSAPINIERSSGSDGEVSVTWQSVAGSAEAGTDFEASSGVLTWADGEIGPKEVLIPITDDNEAEPSETFTVVLSAPEGGVILGPDSVSTVRITDDDSVAQECQASINVGCVGPDARFAVEVTVDTGSDVFPGSNFDIGLRDSTLFYFFSQNNAEMLVKVLDACNRDDALRGFWVLFAATTDRGFTLEITDTVSGEQRTFTNELGNRADAVLELPAFETCDA